MKVVLLFPNNVFTSPYLKYFTQILDKENIPYDLIIWDRENKAEEGCISFRSSNQKKTKFSKLFDFLRFRKFLIEHLKKKDYAKVIVFSGQLGILLSDYLVKHYRKKYVLDIRDYSKPMHIFKNRFKKVIANANFISISSNGFKEWLPTNGNYLLSHNIDIKLIADALVAIPNTVTFNNDIINVDTIGQIKDFESDLKFVDQLKNDIRFRMKFIGFGNTLELLKEHADRENISNVLFLGAYKKEKEKELLKDTDVINILISRTEFNKGATLMSNRIYLSALLKIPCIVNNKTEQSNIIEKYKFGIVVDKYDELPNKLIDYKETFDKDNFMSGCVAFLNDVKKDYQLFESKVTEFLTEK